MKIFETLLTMWKNEFCNEKFKIYKFQQKLMKEILMDLKTELAKFF